jgi:hypothetical protein
MRPRPLVQAHAHVVGSGTFARRFAEPGAIAPSRRSPPSSETRPVPNPGEPLELLRRRGTLRADRHSPRPNVILLDPVDDLPDPPRPLGPAGRRSGGRSGRRAAPRSGRPTSSWCCWCASRSTSGWRCACACSAPGTTSTGATESPSGRSTTRSGQCRRCWRLPRLPGPGSVLPRSVGRPRWESCSAADPP